jgi:hypothetical protein
MPMQMTWFINSERSDHRILIFSLHIQQHSIPLSCRFTESHQAYTLRPEVRSNIRTFQKGYEWVNEYANFNMMRVEYGCGNPATAHTVNAKSLLP